MFNEGRLKRPGLWNPPCPGNDLWASQTNAARSLDLRIDPRLSGLIKCERHGGNIIASERRDCLSCSWGRTTRRRQAANGWDGCDVQMNEAAKRKKSDRPYLISTCGVLTPVRSSSPVSFSRNFLLAFKVKCQVNVLQMGQEIQGVADVGRCGRRFLGRWRSAAAPPEPCEAGKNLLVFLSELLSWLFICSSPVEPLLRKSFSYVCSVPFSGGHRRLLRVSLCSSSYAAECRNQCRREAQGQTRCGFSSFPAGPLAGVCCQMSF